MVSERGAPPSLPCPSLDCVGRRASLSQFTSLTVTASRCRFRGATGTAGAEACAGTPIGDSLVPLAKHVWAAFRSTAGARQSGVAWHAAHRGAQAFRFECEQQGPVPQATRGGEG
eukprot:1796023-Pyramimonas_sp.AAC.2